MSALGKESAKQFLRMYNAPGASRSLQATGKHLLDTSRAGGVKGYMASMLGGGRMRDLGAAADELERLRKLTDGIPVTGQQAHAQQLREAASKFDNVAGQVGRDATPALETYNRWAPRVQYGAPAAAVAGGAGYYFGGNSAENDMRQEWANTPIWGRLAAAATGTKSAHVKQALLGTAIRGGGQVIKGIFGGATNGLVGGAKALGGGLLQSVKNTGTAWKARGAKLKGILARRPGHVDAQGYQTVRPTRQQYLDHYAGQSDWTKPVEALGASSWKLPVYAGATATPFAAYTANQLGDDPRSGVLDSTYQGFSHNLIPAAGNAIGYGWNKGWDIAGNPGAYWDAARRSYQEARGTADDVWQNRDSMGNAIPNLVNYGQQMWKGASISQKQGVVSNIMTAAEHNEIALQMVKVARLAWVPRALKMMKRFSAGETRFGKDLGRLNTMLGGSADDMDFGALRSALAGHGSGKAYGGVGRITRSPSMKALQSSREAMRPTYTGARGQQRPWMSGDRRRPVRTAWDPLPAQHHRSIQDIAARRDHIIDTWKSVRPAQATPQVAAQATPQVAAQATPQVAAQTPWSVGRNSWQNFSYGRSLGLGHRQAAAEAAKSFGKDYNQMHAGWRYGIPAAGGAAATQGYNSYVDAQKRDFLANMPLHQRLGAALSFTLNPQAAANRLF